eukprot:Pompholyxophrys_punicea_v1_NODE_653_length_1522_cov_7.444065.p2 type:complete len:157 gc:universal NODE_653_length_1522_cov_7.444065:495-25(-)
MKYAHTCHSTQGTSKDTITIFDINSRWITKNWLWTAITKVRNLSKVFFYIRPSTATVPQGAPASVNDSVKYLITVIDVMSKYACVKPLKDKRGESITAAMELIIKEARPKLFKSTWEVNFTISHSRACSKNIMCKCTVATVITRLLRNDLIELSKA